VPEHAGSRIACGRTRVVATLSDMRGLRTATVLGDGEALEVASGSGSDKHPHGLQAALPEARDTAARAAGPLTVKLALEFVGTARLAWVPAAGETRLALASDWPHPSFGGQFLPLERTVRDDGFKATWAVSALATTAPAEVLEGAAPCTTAANEAADGEGADAADYAARQAAVASAKPQACLDTLAVSFIDPVNPYVLSDRAVKYGLLFVSLTFVAVGLIEILSGRRVHPVQYLLVGLALSLFFLLLLSLSEHLPFVASYGVAAAACAVLLGFYGSFMLGRARAGLGFGAGIASLYGLLYVLLQMEQNALVIGAVMLFVALAAVMTLTRRVDWYALFQRMQRPATA
jgi:inner membrane protein